MNLPPISLPLLMFALIGTPSLFAAEKNSNELSALLAKVGSTQIFFPKSSDYMRLAERRKLDTLAQLMKSAPGESLIIAGKTDPHGDKDFNDWLRAERSNAVHDYLLSVGVSEDRLMLAETDFISPGKRSTESASQMRRVEFSIAGREEEIAKTLSRPAETSTEANKIPLLPAEFDPAKNFRKLRSRDYELDHMSATAAATKIYFEYTGTSVRTEYWRDLKQLAASLNVTLDAAIAITGYASPNLAPEDATRIARTRAASTAAKLNALGVEWSRMLIVQKPGKTTHPAPHWCNHRVEFAPRVLIEPIEKPQPTFVSVPAPAVLTQSIGSDSLSNLTRQAVIYFGSNSSLLKPRDRRALEEIARLMTRHGETRSLTIRAFADRNGNADANQELSERRQNAVLDTLTEFRAPIDRLFLELVPASASSDQEPSWKLRRVELVVD